MPPVRNTICIDQNKPEMIRLLKAKRVAYDQAKRVHTIEWASQVFSLLTAFVGVTVLQKTYEKHIIFITAVFSVIYLLTFFIAKKKTDEGVNIQEEFDTDLFKINWNEILCGDKIPINDIINLEKQYDLNDPQQNWYSIEILPEIRQTNAILLCQDSNLIWDADLRKRFVAHFILFTLFYYAMFIFYLMYENTSFKHSLNLLFPTAPFFIFSFSTINNIWDIINEKRKLSASIKKAFEKFKNTGIEADYSKIRVIQDIIYSTRKRPEKIPNWYYGMNKKDQQKTMDDCIKESIRKYNLLN